MRISGCSSDVCSSDLGLAGQPGETAPVDRLIVDDLKDRVVKALHVQEAAELKRGRPAKRNDRPVERPCGAYVARMVVQPVVERRGMRIGLTIGKRQRRSEERRGGNEWVSKFMFRLLRKTSKQKHR